jgi:hypothetical protein
MSEYTTVFLSLHRNEFSWPHWELGPTALGGGTELKVHKREKFFVSDFEFFTIL